MWTAAEYANQWLLIIKDWSITSAKYICVTPVSNDISSLYTFSVFSVCLIDARASPKIKIVEALVINILCRAKFSWGVQDPKPDLEWNRILGVHFKMTQLPTSLRAGQHSRLHRHFRLWALAWVESRGLNWKAAIFKVTKEDCHS